MKNSQGTFSKRPTAALLRAALAALLCVTCDVPAARKVCGFTGHNSSKGCSKCNKTFSGSVSNRMDFSGFEPCPLRTNTEHRKQAQEIFDQTSATDQAKMESAYGTRFSELMTLPYFDRVRFHIIDPMHNLFQGTAKHIMKNIRLDPDKPLLRRDDLSRIQSKVDSVPSNIGRMPRKIENSYGGFTADQWKSWTIIFSVFALWDMLPSADLEVWRNFVMAFSLLCSPTITETRVELAHTYIIKFCNGIQQHYGKERVTPNMHLHVHLLAQSGRVICGLWQIHRILTPVGNILIPTHTVNKVTGKVPSLDR